MCGFVFIKHLKSNLNKSLAMRLAEEYISNRGPDYCKYYSTNDEFAFQSVLAIQSEINNPQIKLIKNKTNVLYNGEIYSYNDGLDQKYNSYLDKTENFENCSDLFNYLKELEGMYAICRINKVQNKIISIEIARDPAGEKHLFYYFSENIILISSVPGFIKDYCNLTEINEEVLKDYISRRHLITYEETVFKRLNQLPSSHYLKIDFKNNYQIQKRTIQSFETLFDINLFNNLSKLKFEEYLEFLESVIKNVSKKMVKGSNNNKSGLVISGGIDSSLSSFFINKYFNNKNVSICLDFAGKEGPAAISSEISSICNTYPHILSRPSKDNYLEALLRCQKILAGPVNTHSFPSSMLIAHEGKSNNCRIIYGGEGADELFLGYPCYKNLNFENRLKIKSLYTRHNNNSLKSDYFENIMLNEMQKVFNFLKSFIPEKESYIKASAWLDYHFQLSCVGFYSNDISFSDLGIEGRSIFARRELITLALSTPVKFLINKTTDKLCLEELFKSKFKISPQSKSGFAGFPNETKENLPPFKKWLIWDLLGERPVENNLNRALMWKYINLEWFLEHL